MKHTRIHLEWYGTPARQFRTGLSLHSHTLHSKETLSFIYRLANRIAPLRKIMQHGEARYRALHGSPLDLKRAWWTPPIAPRDAWLLEKNHIERRLQLNPLVSLTDHDDIEAPLGLRVLEEFRDLPISFEWTVPYGPTFFHLGVHNLVPDTARKVVSALLNLTATKRTADLASLLQTVSNNPETLIVFNHPCWDESGIGRENHLSVAEHFVRTYGQFIHALELNGLRPWKENRQVLRMASDLNKPIVSGGDRHALEPNAILDLTNAATFSEFVEQVRSGWTNVFITNAYREPFGLRILQGIEEVLQDHDNHGRGWRQWSDRVFYHCDDGIVRSLTELFPRRLPGAVQLFVNSIALSRYHGFRRTFRFAFSRQDEFAL